ncbi:MAG TPA: PmoA family protein [Sedimentisphaerales bacterium]|nr:PmoA family protein [Sedimentisphaerales bacterium]
MTRKTNPIAATAIILAVGSFVSAEPSGETKAGQKVAAKIEKDEVAVTIEGKLFTCYKFAKTQKYPYFWPVNGPASGKSVTSETSEPYPHHRSLFFGCDRVNGGNYWQEGNERGQILSQGQKIIEPDGQRVVFTDECLWKQPGAEPIIKDHRRITITAPGKEIRIIDFDITIEPLTDVTILKTNHALFSARVVPELSVSSGGTLVNAEGNAGEKGTWGVNSAWCDYHGTRDGVTEGIAILDNPNNPWFPSKWFTRDYGFFSPTPMNWLEDDKLQLSKGKKLKLQYRVVVHTGDAEKAGMKGIFAEYKRSAQPLKTGASP